MEDQALPGHLRAGQRTPELLVDPVEEVVVVIGVVVERDQALHAGVECPQPR